MIKEIPKSTHNLARIGDSSTMRIKNVGNVIGMSADTSTLMKESRILIPISSPRQSSSLSPPNIILSEKIRKLVMEGVQLSKGSATMVNR